MQDYSVAVIIPTLNGGCLFEKALISLKNQSFAATQKIIIDSESEDNTRALAEEAGFETITIARNEFNHGRTRQLGIEIAVLADIIIMLTQDAVLADEKALEKIVACFCDAKVGAAYGRQLPQGGAGAFGAHAREFNYPSTSEVKSKEDISRLAIKTAFISNSFAAYRRSALLEIGGFPKDVILGEDMYVAAKLILDDWKVAYCAEAMAYHSHDYTVAQEFSRYFDIGVFHAQQTWIGNAFGKSEGEGLRFVKSEWLYLWRASKAKLILNALIRTVAKYAGYRLGAMEHYLPVWLKRRWSMHSEYWKDAKE